MIFLDFFSENEKQHEKIASFRDFFSPFFEITIIKVVTPRPRHFLGRHLYHTSAKMLPSQLGQLPIDAN